MVLKLENVALKKAGSMILENINWEVQKGEHWVLLGLNGAGKTALLNMICNYDFPTSGKVDVLGKKFGVDSITNLRKTIGFVSSALQEKLYPSDNAFEIVLSGAFSSIGLYETPTDEIRTKAINILKELGCIDYANRDYETLSSGEKQRVLIGRALMSDPELLILDEPTNGLDFIAREQLLEAIENISGKSDSPTVLYVTHHIEEILPSFTKTLLLKSGKVFKAGNTDEVLNSEIISEFFGLPVDVIWQNNRPMVSKKVLTEKEAR